MSDNSGLRNHRKVKLFPLRSTNRHLNTKQFGTPMRPKHKVINHLDWNPSSGQVKHVVEYISEWQ